MVSYKRIVSEAKKLQNIPFCHRGSSTLGVDCSGFIRLVYNRAGISISPFGHNFYNPRWWQNDNGKEEFLNGLINEWKFEIVDEPYPGGLVAFRLYMRNGPVNHAGIILNNTNVIHARCGRRKRNNGSVIDDLELYISYQKNIAYYLKHIEVDYG